MKMKKPFFLKAVLTSFLVVFFVAPAVMAYTIQTGPGYGKYSADDAGEFTVLPVGNSTFWTSVLSLYNPQTKNIHHDGTFQTFCLEYFEYIDTNTTYTADFNNKAIDGGVGPTGDPISVGTAWLYHQFESGTLEGYNYTDTDDRLESAGELQLTIWWLEGEIQNEPFNDFTTLVKGLSNYMDGNNGKYPVSVLNLYYRDENAQDLLVCDPAPVPEPGTMLLVGSGLIGLAGLARKKFHKK